MLATAGTEPGQTQEPKTQSESSIKVAGIQIFYIFFEELFFKLRYRIAEREGEPENGLLAIGLLPK